MRHVPRPPYARRARLRGPFTLRVRADWARVRRGGGGGGGGGLRGGGCAVGRGGEEEGETLKVRSPDSLRHLVN